MNHLDLFSGIGGFALATQLAGLPIVNRYYSDIEEYANRVYQKNFPAAIGLGDITKIDGKKLREKHGQEPWLITGGFPCQDISTAGAMRGLNSDRSGLWFHYWRLIDELRPQAAVIENVSALCSNGLDRVLISLADIGYDAEWSTISAAEVGAPHLRKRVWIVAYPQTATNTDNSQCRSSKQLPAKATDTTGNGYHGPTERHQTQWGRDVADGLKPYGPTDGARAWPAWEAEAAKNLLPTRTIIPRMDDGIPNRVDIARVRGLGNAIVPQVAAGVLSRMQAVGLLDQIDTERLAA